MNIQFSEKPITSFFLLLLGLLLLSACGGGGGGGGGTTNDTEDDDPIPPGDGPYLAYQVGNNIHVVDKTDPTKTKVVTDDALHQGTRNHTGGNVFLVSKAEYDINTKTVTFLGPELMVYAGKTKFWKVDMAKGSNLAPVALMGDTYSDVCKIEFDEDNITLEYNVLFYELPGLDDDCNGTVDNTRWLMRVSKSNLYPAVEITSFVDKLSDSVTKNKIIFPVRDNENNNSVTGFLAVKDDDFRHYNEDFSASTTVITATDINSLRTSSSAHVGDGGFISVDKKLYWYNIKTKKTSSILHTSPDGMVISGFNCDQTECFFSDVEIAAPNDQIVYKVEVGGTAVATALTGSKSSFGSTFNLHVTPDYLYVNNGNDQTLISIARSNGDIKLIDSFVTWSFSFNGNLYYSLGADAVIRPWDGGDITTIIENSSWRGVVYSAFTGDFGNITGSVLLVKKPGVQADLSNAIVESYDVETNTKQFELGILPNKINLFYSVGLSTGGTLGQLGEGEKFDFISDLLWFDPAKENSLTRLTNDSIYEEIIFP
ncbi:MAG: hypothetical protein OEY52_06235 [Gammaproteobacteria bacterium]|nr:hypothetical protein [Gammaproteobacteria bacterium]